MGDDRSDAHDAGAVAAAAAAAAAVSVHDLHDHTASRAVSRLFDAVWGRSGEAGPMLSAEAITAITHAGGQVSGAYAGEGLVGATVAFLGRDASGGVFLHSHITGVSDASAGTGVGKALKWHQRAWCLQRGITEVRWTFDPLVRRNAVLNLHRLGAGVTGYARNVYGEPSDARNAGLPTDRLRVSWQLDSPRVTAAARGRGASPDVHALLRSGAVVLLDTAEDDAPVLGEGHGERALVRIPADVEALRTDRPQLASAWAAAIRATLGATLDEGFGIRGITPEGWYVLSADTGVSDLAAPSGDARA